MKSKFRSVCKRCHNTINVGDELYKNSKYGWIHEECPPEKGKGQTLAQVLTSNSGVNIPLEIGVEDTANEVTSFSTDWEPSDFQKDIFAFIETGTGNAVIEAVAGSGKTTTIVKALEILPKDTNIAFLAFNKHIAKELSARAPSNVHVSTIHSLGLSVIKKHQDFKDVQADRLDDIFATFYPITKEIPFALRKVNRQKRSVLRKMVSLAKATLVDASSTEAVLQMMERFGIGFEEGQEDHTIELIGVLPKVLQACIDNIEYVDYDDMVWLPIVHHELRNHIDKFEVVFVDEAQDLNNCQTQFVLKSVYQGGRIIVVGDRNQSLYGFRGADTDAIPNLIRELDARILPLSISYRCPASHVALAKEIVPQIEASTTAKIGSVAHVTFKEFKSMLNAGDMVICRTNAPLVKPAFDVIRAGTKAIIRGRDIGRSLVNFIERFEADDLNRLEVLMNQFTQNECQRLLDQGKELQADLQMDKYKTVASISSECKTVAELTSKVEILFSDTNTGVVFSSVHRAKGLEAERVFILHEELMPHPKATQEWEQVQEMNVKYVALTRSKNELFFVENEEELK